MNVGGWNWPCMLADDGYNFVYFRASGVMFLELRSSPCLTALDSEKSSFLT